MFTTDWAARRAKREGMKAGFPDLMVLWPNGGIGFIEFKVPGGRVSESQAEWIQRLWSLGHCAGIAYSIEDAIGFLRSWGAPVQERAA